MFRVAWIQRLAQAEGIIDTTNPPVLCAYEGKISDLARSKTMLQDQLTHHITPISVIFEEN